MTRICPWWLVFTFDNKLRPLLHNPERVLGPYVRPGMAALDLGCGRGFNTINLARLVGEQGRVVAVDLQAAMLQMAGKRLRRLGLLERVSLHQGSAEQLDFPGAFDFVNIFWMAHEVPNQAAMFARVKALLRPTGRVLLVEPKMHVAEPAFEQTLARAVVAGLQLVERPAVALSRAALLAHRGALIFLALAAGLACANSAPETASGVNDAGPPPPGADAADAAPSCAAQDQCAADQEARPCATDLECLAASWPVECDGRWRCPDGGCEPVCEPRCAGPEDCAARPWTANCEGHWVCENGDCHVYCETVVCEHPADCIVLPWPGECEGHWECGAGGACSAVCDVTQCDEAVPFHEPRLDPQGKLLPWAAYDEVIRLALEFFRQCPEDATTGLPWYMQYCSFRYQEMAPSPWPHNPAGLYAMLVETVVRYWPYSGDREWIEIVRRPLDHLIAESTPDSYAWPRVPYASADNSGQYRGGSAEGLDGIEPDKVAQAAVAYLRFHKLTGESRYLDLAVHCADVLAANVWEGDRDRSPWPFRVNGRTGEIIEEYTSDMIWPIALFDELNQLGLASPQHLEARQMAWQWLLEYPVNNMHWKGYFEDVTVDTHNINREQYTAGETARYLLRHPEMDPQWAEHVAPIITWIKDIFGDQSEKWPGATGIREQIFCLQIASSHTARYASLNALFFAATGDAAYREEALGSFAFATYFCREDGIVIFSICDTDVWFSDGYADYVPHFIDGMAALPEMAPDGEDHLLFSSSVVTGITYEPGKIAYQTFDPAGREILKLSFAPRSVSAAGTVLSEQDAPGGQPGYTYDAASGVLRIWRENATVVEIAGTP